MIQILPYIQVGLSILLVTGILLQRSEGSLGSAFGGGDTAGGKFNRRGFEKLLFNGTVVIAVLFAISAFLTLLLSR